LILCWLGRTNLNTSQIDISYTLIQARGVATLGVVFVTPARFSRKVMSRVWAMVKSLISRRTMGSQVKMGTGFEAINLLARLIKKLKT
jgi:hypothetical protein